ncbi:dipeptide ABC transporter ATP-binding protein [Pseudomonas chlororaphis]|uniref:ABC transporter ATP-binding protein n=1 Tax=Pseudomonas chlororaphis TaxID=587753 RepID=A0AAX3FNF7_9PSED|nr:ABC transporter ATP-binding protein [Pseudomonas chlororaphis]AZC37543.1 ABC transporter, ATP-binding protein [Pseudomonas chlororaphis subsp. piscium]AZC44092.1 ABC transporter, ATP-binding protein [Pseudomonas chlororaphis subsp. piscium]WDG69744.1 ABC transporter ATP-binding protein [Pseudomonas chlororaphis]WDH26430.1 ABC transporter ATP-binding protein [Pseudomonas chlororaphis]WDH68270.1 ABC transporter ATP-binding protein [Pseudomonas chlororaphis]
MNLIPEGPEPLIRVSDLQVRFGAHAAPTLKGISFELRRGECLALVGESGSGKSVTSRTLAGLTGANALIQASRLEFAGQDLRRFDERAWRRIRGAQIGFVMQDALGSLDPLRPVGKEIAEPLELHSPLDRAQRQARVLELLRAVGVPEPELRARQYPFQLSGGLRQRALIASAIACNPRLLIADEPTTALDATVQAQVLDLLESLRGDSTAMLIVSHDLAVVSRLANRVAVMHNGVIVEQGSVEEVLHDPQHPYTQFLLRAGRAVHFRRPAPSPRPILSAVAPVRGEAPPLLQVDELSKAFKGPDGRLRRVVDGVSLQLRRGQTLGIVGESGSGKTTLTRMILGLETPDSGDIQLLGQLWLSLPDAQKRQLRRSIQVVFQDPLSSFDPRYSVQRVLFEALQVAGHPRRDWAHKAVELLGLVRLDAALLGRRPLELSGGQRQRVAIARALAAGPKILVCDEPVSALDVSVQAQILELLDDLKQRLGLACLFISHDLGVINHVSDAVLVMKDGRVVEAGPVREVFDHPQHPYTLALLDAIPHLESGRRTPFEFLKLAI